MKGRDDKAVRLAAFVRAEAKALGFSDTGICDPNVPDAWHKHLLEYVEAGHHGTMAWLKDTMDRRAAPKALWPDVRSVILLSMNYGPETNPLEALDHRDRGVISVYARNRDYHDVIKGRLKTLAAKLIAKARTLEETGDVKVFVDTAPVMEKPLAQKAGLGWQGKHTNLVSRSHGSWLFLGSIFTTLNLRPDAAEMDHCGSCNSCLDACPTDAFPAPYKLDARRCISYLTIEHDGPIAEEFRKPMGNRIYGCDDCLAVCPWNKFAHMASEAKLAAPTTARPDRLADLLKLDDAGFRNLYAGSPIKRIGRNRFIRNCLIAAGNSAKPDLMPLVDALRNDADDTIRQTADWALAQLKQGNDPS